MYRPTRLCGTAHADSVRRCELNHLLAHQFPARSMAASQGSDQPARVRPLRDGGTTLMRMRVPVRLRSLNAAQREPAQIIVLFAVFIIVLMVLAGSAYDYASIVVDDARLQNAV